MFFDFWPSQFLRDYESRSNGLKNLDGGGGTGEGCRLVGRETTTGVL